MFVTTFPLAGSAQMGPPGGASGPTEVGVVTLEQTEVPFTVTLPGRAAASEQTEIRPRVGGMIEEILFQPGTNIEAGDVLFRLEADSYEAAYAAAEAELASAQAARDTAQATVDRYTRLEGVGVTTSDLQAAQASLAQAEATLSGAKASLQSAKLDLDRVIVTSPIAGVVDVSQVSVGALVTANQADALTTVTALDPIFVDVAESSARITRVRERIDQGAMQPGAALDATVTLESGSTYQGTGTLVSPGISVSTSTGSVDMRFQFDNPDRMILPGQFLRVQLAIGSQSAILVPQRATERQSDGTLTAFLATDGRAEQVTLSYTGTYQNAWVVTDGVSAGDQVIVDGLSNLTDGAEVTTVPVTITASGVVEEVASGGDSAPAADAAPAEGD
ncbi:MAG: efflux RND transporter periplasmic adaptor subunit [Maritimibacter sp.]|nr:efflux RND transporter periplasmic adaptor subunit [Maritimibacter sp.]